LRANRLARPRADQLSDATLTAPFDGVIARRFVEPNQNIQARAPVVKFQDVDEVEVIVDVPESVMAADLRTADIVQLSARFSAAPDVEFLVQIREVSQRADPTTQTFRVRTVMKSPTEIRLLPGMTATVTLSYRRSSLLGSRILVPVAALFKEPSGEQVVWVID
jgi:RND family efflux transporter MFP subunit